MCFLYWLTLSLSLFLSCQVLTICITEESINSLLESYPDTQIYCAAIDQKHSNGISVVPGIGDAGDRQFVGPVYNRDTDAELCGYPK